MNFVRMLAVKTLWSLLQESQIWYHSSLPWPTVHDFVLSHVESKRFAYKVECLFAAIFLETDTASNNLVWEMKNLEDR